MPTGQDLNNLAAVRIDTDTLPSGVPQHLFQLGVAGQPGRAEYATARGVAPFVQQVAATSFSGITNDVFMLAGYNVDPANSVAVAGEFSGALYFETNYYDSGFDRTLAELNFDITPSGVSGHRSLRYLVDRDTGFFERWAFTVSEDSGGVFSVVGRNTSSGVETPVFQVFALQGVVQVAKAIHLADSASQVAIEARNPGTALALKTVAGGGALLFMPEQNLVASVSENLNLFSTGSASGGSPLVSSRGLRLFGSRWTGAAAANEWMSLRFTPTGNGTGYVTTTDQAGSETGLKLHETGRVEAPSLRISATTEASATDLRVLPEGTATPGTTTHRSYPIYLAGSAWTGSAAVNRGMRLRTQFTSPTVYRLSILNDGGSEVAFVSNTGSLSVATLIVNGSAQTQGLTATGLALTGPASMTGGDLVLNRSIAGDVYTRILNSESAGNSSRALLLVGQTLAGNKYGILEFLNDGHSTSGARIPNRVLLRSFQAAGLAITAENASGSVQIYTGGTGTGNLRYRVTSGGIHLFGTTVSTSAGAGDVVLANGKAIRSVNAAGTDTRAMVSVDSSNRLTLEAASAAVAVANASTATTVGAAGAGDALPANPEGYLVVRINGTDRKIPFYTA